jgi:hypothetical protein
MPPRASQEGGRLLHEQKKLAEQKRRLARFNAEHPVFIG